MPSAKHLITFSFLGPFLVMLLFQKLLNYDDNLMVLPSPGKRDGQFYNLIMGLTFWPGVIAYFIHMVRHAHDSWRWLIAKVAFLVSLFVMLFM